MIDGFEPRLYNLRNKIGVLLLRFTLGGNAVK